MVKRFLLIILSVLMCCLAACSNSEIIEESSIAASSEDRSLEESSEPDFSLENVLYFTGDYIGNLDHTTRPIMEFTNVREIYSIGEGGLDDFIKCNHVSNDTWFLVGVCPNYRLDSNHTLDEVEKYLTDNGFIVVEDHPMMWDQNFREEWLAATADEEREQLEFERLQIMLPGVDIKKALEKYAISEILNCKFYIVGYINVETIEKLGNDPKLDYPLELTWFPAPNNYERFLTMEILHY